MNILTINEPVVGEHSARFSWTLEPASPLYNAAQGGASKDKAGAIITMNPYVAAAKFVMEKNAPEKMVKKTAGDISAQIATQMKQYGAMPAKQ